MSEALSETRERRVLDTELLWAFGVGVLVAATIGMILFTALTENINPPSNVERVDPKTLHLLGEFAEQNLGTIVGADGTVTARIIATQFMFAPHLLFCGPESCGAVRCDNACRLDLRAVRVFKACLYQVNNETLGATCKPARYGRWAR
jgi:hypothetical protein